MGGGECSYDWGNRRERSYDGRSRSQDEPDRGRSSDTDRREQRTGGGGNDGGRRPGPPPICFGCKVLGHYRSDCWADPLSRRQAKRDGYTCPPEHERRGISVSPRRSHDASLERSPSVDLKTTSKLEELGESVQQLREFVDLVKTRQTEKERRRQEREEAKQREEEERRAEEARAAKKREKQRRCEEEQLAMTKAVELQLAMRLSLIHEDIKSGVRKCVAKGKEAVVEDLPSTSGNSSEAVEIVTNSDDTNKLVAAEKRKRGEDILVGDSPPVITPTK
ncbi:hypothetical protein CBR_g38239 [Chara braunii]|uniref:CCHC-type domain-containing protein n=1 Tax=Chara braunii TaxID=69332 RepID=A0A388LPL0_CHABU|nr:hypothetical protein CBR_g38239 [Chara braunii]|eukprot:GBG84268.1 hypothetical protein CBR_g38239 [Chara braunii]